MFRRWMHDLLEVGPVDTELLKAHHEHDDGLHAGAGRPAPARSGTTDGIDLVSYLLEQRPDGEPIPDDELVKMLFLLLIAGVDTTWSSIGSSMLHLATHPEDRRRLAADPSLVPTAVEEFLRAYNPVVIARVATRDTEVGGCPVAQGDWVMMAFNAANRDPDVFERADEVLLDRQHNRHLGFGLGRAPLPGLQPGPAGDEHRHRGLAGPLPRVHASPTPVGRHLVGRPGPRPPPHPRPPRLSARPPPARPGPASPQQAASRTLSAICTAYGARTPTVERRRVAVGAHEGRGDGQAGRQGGDRDRGGPGSGRRRGGAVPGRGGGGRRHRRAGRRRPGPRRCHRGHVPAPTTCAPRRSGPRSCARPRSATDASTPWSTTPASSGGPSSSTPASRTTAR